MKEINIPIIFDFYPNLFKISKSYFIELIRDYFLQSRKKSNKLIDLPNDEFYIYNNSKFSLEDITSDSFKIYENFELKDYSLDIKSDFKFTYHKFGYQLNLIQQNLSVPIEKTINLLFFFKKNTIESLFSIIAYKELMHKFNISNTDYELYKQLSKYPKVVYNPSLN